MFVYEKCIYRNKGTKKDTLRPCEVQKIIILLLSIKFVFILFILVSFSIAYIIENIRYYATLTFSFLKTIFSVLYKI